MRVLILQLVFLGLSGLVEGSPLRVDLNSSQRGDMRTRGWENWMPSGEAPRTSFGKVSVALGSGSQGGKLRGHGVKALVVDGVTLGADGVIASGGQSAVLELRIEGLAAGKHSFVGYHHSLLPGDDLLSLSIGGQKVEGIRPSSKVRHNDEIASSYLEFEAKADEPVVVRIEATDGDQVVLSGFALDASDPRHRASQPQPADLTRHADGDQGTVTVRWLPAPSAVRHQVVVASDHDPRVAARKLDDQAQTTVTTGNAHPVPVTKDSLLHYAWRIDSEDATGRVTRGEVWRFRVRQLAFPSAEGYGRFAIGGRGGRVIHVTNLDDSGPGSLRAAVEATGPRTVVFDVSGLITLKSKLLFREENEFLTIAGQTAPGKGICLRNYTFGGLGGRDTVVRYLRVRLGDLTGETMDGMGLSGCDHCIVDHCSISWSIDEAFSSRGAKNITLQRSLISEALNIAGHKKYGKGAAHGFAGSISGDIGSFHHNLLAHNAGRNWSLAGAIDQANRHAGRLDIRNTVVYNWQHRTTDGGARQVNFVNNYYKPGPATETTTYLNPQFEHPAFGPQQYYVSGNIVDGVSAAEGPQGPFKGVVPRGRQEASVTVARPFFPSYVETHSAKKAYENVLRDVGCNFPKLDDHDRRVIRETRTGKVTYRGSRSDLPGLPDSQRDVGGWEPYPIVRRPDGWDTDRDGMPNAWEKERGLDPNDPADGRQDSDGDGYTSLEDYLNWLARAGGAVE